MLCSGIDGGKEDAGNWGVSGTSKDVEIEASDADD